jgi:hypothetical protein
VFNILRILKIIKGIVVWGLFILLLIASFYFTDDETDNLQLPTNSTKVCYEGYYRYSSNDQPLKCKEYDMENVKTSHVENMSYMFAKTKNLNPEVTFWDTSKVKNMKGMFFKNESFNQMIGSWDVDQVEDFSYMFYEAKNFNNNLDNWNFKSVKSLSGINNMIKGTNLDIFQYNGLVDRIYETNSNNWTKEEIKNTIGVPAGNYDYEGKKDSKNFRFKFEFIKEGETKGFEF